MTLGPVQVLVIGVPDDGAPALFESLAAALSDGPVRWLDSFAVTADADGNLDVEPSTSTHRGRSLRLFAEAIDDSDAGDTATYDDGWFLGDVVPPSSRAVVVVLEHRWARGMRDSMLSAGAGLRFETWLDEDDRARLESVLDSAD